MSELVEVPKATLPFYKYEKDGLVYYEFDATQCTTPEPMVNAMAGLQMLRDKNDRLVGLFFHKPIPLLGRVEGYFAYDVEETKEGDVRITFRIG